MFEKFTERARHAMTLARQDAQARNDEFIGTENILAGLIRDGEGVANKMLKLTNTPPEAVLAEIDRLRKEHAIDPPLPPVRQSGQLPFSPRAKRVIELAGEFATVFGNDVVGTEHLFLGLRKENEGIAAQVLFNLGITLDMLARAHVTVVPPPEPDPNPAKIQAAMTKYGRTGPVFKTPNGTLLTLSELLALTDHQVITSLDVKKLVWGEDAKS